MIILRQHEFGGRSVYEGLTDEEKALKRADRDQLARELLEKRKKINSDISESKQKYDNLNSKVKNSKYVTNKDAYDLKKAKWSMESDKRYREREYNSLLGKSKIKSEQIDNRYKNFHNSGNTGKVSTSSSSGVGGFNSETVKPKQKIPVSKTTNIKNNMGKLALGAAAIGTVGAGAYLLHKRNQKKKEEE